MSEDYGVQFSSVFQHWESDIQSTKDQDKKLSVIFRSSFKLQVLVESHCI